MIGQTMPWIDTVPYEQAEGRLRRLYDRVKGPGDNVVPGAAPLLHLFNAVEENILGDREIGQQAR